MSEPPTPPQRCNAATLFASRGPGFVMPPESGFRLAPGLNGKEPSAAFKTDAALGVEPTSEELSAVVLSMCDAQEVSEQAGGSEAHQAPSVCFAGLGEPLLRLDTLLDTVRRVKARRPGVSFRVSTNGLFDSSVAVALADGGIERATVALASADGAQYDALMRPVRLPGEQRPRGLRDVVAFITRLSMSGVFVEVGVVAHPDVDVAAARRLAHTVGANGVRVRTYFP